MAAATNPTHTSPSNPPPIAPDLDLNPNQNLNANNNNRPQVTPVTTANKVAAVVILALAAIVITATCLALPFPAALTISLVTGLLAISLATALLSDCHSVTVIDGRPRRNYFWHHWWSPSVYTPPLIIDRSYPYYRPSPIIISREPHVRVGGGHSRRVFPSFRPENHVRVGGGHGQPARFAPSFRAEPHFRTGGGHFARPAPSHGFGGGGRVQVGGRRH